MPWGPSRPLRHRDLRPRHGARHPDAHGTEVGTVKHGKTWQNTKHAGLGALNELEVE